MPRPPLISREAAVAEAVRVLDDEGVGALSMRRIAQRLGVSSPSLYKHFRDLDDVLDAVADAIIEEITSQLPHDTTSWRHELDQLARRYRDTFRNHPHALALVMRRPVRSESSLAGLNAVLQILLDDGWSAARAARALLLVESFAFGAALTSASAGFAGEVGAGFPALSAALSGSHPKLRLGSEDFEHGLELLLDGIAAELSPANDERR
ncbi:TetR/AcrR family transcriptional regulator [Saccharopolyspora griseoalba]|uniref:TetR/AcrR family transcriptional regulator n=1 Tax=Saccharopolyspora griseoalba TaxID=1431848 RepID=A0ABW2LKP5_9PSEU